MSILAAAAQTGAGADTGGENPNFLFSKSILLSLHKAFFKIASGEQTQLDPPRTSLLLSN